MRMIPVEVQISSEQLLKAILQLPEREVEYLLEKIIEMRASYTIPRLLRSHLELVLREKSRQPLPPDIQQFYHKLIDSMLSTPISTVTKMLEILPEEAQNKVVEHLREYIKDLRDEMKWDESFKNSQNKLIEAARRARQEIDAGNATPMDFEQL